MSVVVATGGTVPREDRCAKCGKPMMYALDGGGRVVASFCANLQHGCRDALRQIPEPSRRMGDQGEE